MKIVNFKINIIKIIYFLIITIGILLVFYFLLHFLNFVKSEKIVMTNENYTDILKECHENLDSFINKEIYTIGYVHRPSDIKNDEIVIARDMLINKNEAQIVGFLAKCNYASDYEDNIWVEVRGRISKGEYHGEIPIIEIKSIKKITTPEDIFVYPPKNM